MAQRDIFHTTVIKALEKDGWTITHDPYHLRIGGRRLAIDLGAERLISAQKGMERILVEVKSFIGRSNVRDLEQALGQYVLYQQVLNEKNIEWRLYLAVPDHAYRGIFQETVGHILLKNGIVRLLVFDDEQEVLTRWIPD